MPRMTVAQMDGGGDSFYAAVQDVQTSVNLGNRPLGAKPPGATEKAQNAAAAKATKIDQIVDERSQALAQSNAAQARNQGDSTAAAKTYPTSKDEKDYNIATDPYYMRDPITGLSPAQVEALQAQKDAAAAKAEAIAEYYRLQEEAAAAAKAKGDGTRDDGTGNDGTGDTGTGDTGAGNTGTGNKGAGTDTTVTGGGLGAGAGGKGPVDAAQQAILDQIKALTEQLARQQELAAAEANKPKVVGTRTVRKTGGVVDVVEVMSDGSTGKTIESYKDFGARDSVMKMFENTGLGDDFIKSLMDTVDKVYEDNIMPTEAQVLNSIYTSDAYKTRFAANEIIRKRMAEGKGLPGDRLLKPAEYIQTEIAYKEIMSEAGLPSYFYDQQEDFTKLIGELGTSVAEVSERVNIAKRALQDADQNIKDALKSYYGWSEGDMVAYLLDPEKAFRAIDSRFTYTTPELQRRYSVAEIGGAATRAGMTGITEKFGEEIRAAGKADVAERAFQGAARDQQDYQRLLGLYGEKAGTEDLAREALALAGGAEVGIKTKKLASKERAKFQQRSAIDKTSLGSRLRSPDV